MANYKTRPDYAVKAAGIYYSVPKDKMKILYYFFNGVQTPKSLFDTSDLAVFVTTSSEKFRILGGKFITNGTSTQPKLYQADTQDAITLFLHTITTSTDIQYEFAMIYDIAPSKLVTIDPTNVNLMHVELYGYIIDT